MAFFGNGIKEVINQWFVNTAAGVIAPGNIHPSIAKTLSVYERETNWEPKNTFALYVVKSLLLEECNIIVPKSAKA